jgi:iron complex transport system ATP-binding protein
MNDTRTTVQTSLSPNDGVNVHDVVVQRGTQTVLKNISFTAPSAGITALIGPNGAGKSTLLSALLGIIPLKSGIISAHGVPCHTLSRTQRACTFGYVPQRTKLQAPMAVADVVAMGRYAHGGTWFGAHNASDIIDHALSQVQALHLRQRPFNELSAGEAQRVLVARALVGGARILLLDEPTSSLDIGHALMLYETLQQLAHSGQTIIIALHHLDDVRRIADQVVLLHDGVQLMADAPMTVLNSPHLTTAFGVEHAQNDAWSFRLRQDGI